MTPILAPPAPDPRVRDEALSRTAARRVADVLRESDRGMTAQEIADVLGLHHTGVRVQLNSLVEAGVLVSSTDPPQGRGRPRTRFSLAPDPRAQEAAGHRELVRLLMGLVRRLGLGEDDMEEFGIGQGAGMVDPEGGPQELVDAFARLGFAPRVVPGAAPQDLVLDRCPFAAGVEAPGGDLICVLHRGLARGITSACMPDVRVAGLDANDPHTAGCRLRLERA